MSYIPQKRSISTKLKHAFEYTLLRTSYFTINLIPLFLIDLLTSFISKVIWWFFPFRITVAYDNLSTVFPRRTHRDKLTIIKAAYKQLINAAGLIFVIHRPNVFKIIENARISGLDILDEALSEGKGVILTTYHGCWFEAYFAWFSKEPRPTTLIYKRQKNPLSDAFFVKLRRRYGTNLHHVDKYEKLSKYQDELDAQRIVIISLDQNYIDNGVAVTFFDKKYICARGAALLHLKTHAPVLTSVYYVKNGNLHIEFERVDLPAYSEISDQNMQEITTYALKHYEKTISTYPDQWFSLFHRLWKKTGYPSKIKRTFKEIFTA